MSKMAPQENNPVFDVLVKNGECPSIYIFVPRYLHFSVLYILPVFTFFSASSSFSVLTIKHFVFSRSNYHA